MLVSMVFLLARMHAYLRFMLPHRALRLLRGHHGALLSSRPHPPSGLRTQLSLGFSPIVSRNTSVDSGRESRV